MRALHVLCVRAYSNATRANPHFGTHRTRPAHAGRESAKLHEFAEFRDRAAMANLGEIHASRSN